MLQLRTVELNADFMIEERGPPFDGYLARYIQHRHDNQGLPECHSQLSSPAVEDVGDYQV